MKKNVSVLPALLLGAVFLMTACTTVDLATNRTGWSDYAETAVKDFEPVGIVRVTSKETFKVAPFGFLKSKIGSKVTYDMLISEAVKLNADDIINVRIDTIDKNSTHPFAFITGSKKEVEYIGTALAIKYKTPVDAVGKNAGATLGDSGILRSQSAGSTATFPERIKSLLGI